MKTVVILLLLLVVGACAAPEATPGQSTAETADQPAAGTEPISPTGASGPAIGPVAGVLVAQRDGVERGLTLRRLDPATGNDLAGYPPLIVGGERMSWAAYSLSASGQRLAVVESRGRSCDPYAGGTRCRPGADVLHMVDVEARREVTTTLAGNAYAWPLSFSPDESLLAVGLHERGTYTLTVFDTAGGRLVAERPLPFEPSLVAFTAAGSEIAAFGSPPGEPAGIGRSGAPRLLLIDAATLETRWEQELPDVLSGGWCLEACQAEHGKRLFAYWTPGVALDPVAERLYVVHADAEQITTLDLQARTVQTADIRTARSWLGDLLALGTAAVQAKGGTEGAVKAAALSPDGTRLYVVGQAMHSARNAEQGWQYGEEGLGVQVIDVETGRRIARREGNATGIQLSPGGAYMLLSGWREGEPFAEVLDASSLETLARLDGWQGVLAHRSDGQTLILVSWTSKGTTELATLAAPSFEIAPLLSVAGTAEWLGIP